MNGQLIYNHLNVSGIGKLTYNNVNAVVGVPGNVNLTYSNANVIVGVPGIGNLKYSNVNSYSRRAGF